MPEIDVRNSPWVVGFPREHQLVDRELYRLLTIFAASPKLAELQRSDQGGCVYSWSVRTFEYPEIGRILVSLAAMLRNDWDADRVRIEQNLSLQPSTEVGVLFPNLNRPSKSVPLELRESLNKILHAHTINLDRSEGPTVCDGHLIPRVFLYGEKRNVPWKATLEIYTWVERLFAIA